MPIVLYALGGLFLLSAVGALGDESASAMRPAAIGAGLVAWGYYIRRRRMQDAAAVGSVSHAIEQAGRLADVVTDSLKLARDSHDAETKLSQLDVARTRLEELKAIADAHSWLSISSLEEAEREIVQLEESFELAGYRAAIEAKARGAALEQEGSVDAAIAVYESLLAELVEDPFAYRRLAILYRNRKQRDDELRVLKAAIRNVPRDNAKHYGWFAERLAKLSQ
jgi:tetratricopeptide (TPR) repeat protein